MLVVTFSLAACGGGGSTGSPALPPASAPSSPAPTPQVLNATGAILGTFGGGFTLQDSGCGALPIVTDSSTTIVANGLQIQSGTYAQVTGTGTCATHLNATKVILAKSLQGPLPTASPAPTNAPVTTATPTPSPIPAATPTPKPAATPTPPPVVQGSGLRNGTEWPLSFKPYAPSSIWNRAMTNQTKPSLYPGSDAMIATAEQGDDRPVRIPAWGGGWDQGHAVFLCDGANAAGCVSVKVQCTMYCIPGKYPSTMLVPVDAHSSDGGDNHFAIVQPDGSEIDTWATRLTPGSWHAGDTMVSGTVNDCGNFYNGSGIFGREGASTVGDVCIGGGLIRAAELQAGQIDHALFTTLDCGARSNVFPAYQPIDVPCSGPGTHMPNGSHLWSDLDDAQVDALAIKTWEKAILKALHHYGAYVGDTASGATRAHGAFMPWFEDGAQFTSLGVQDPVAAWARTQGWNPVTIAPLPNQSFWRSTTWYTFSDSWNPMKPVGGWAAHLHVVDACYAQGAC